MYRIVLTVDGQAGWRVVRILEAAQRSIERGGAPVALSAAALKSPVFICAPIAAASWRATSVSFFLTTASRTFAFT